MVEGTREALHELHHMNPTAAKDPRVATTGARTVSRGAGRKKQELRLYLFSEVLKCTHFFSWLARRLGHVHISFSFSWRTGFVFDAEARSPRRRGPNRGASVTPACWRTRRSHQRSLGKASGRWETFLSLRTAWRRCI